MKILSVTFLMMFTMLGTAASKAAEMPADSLYRQATTLLARGDSLRALATLDSLLSQDKDHWVARLARGSLHLNFRQFESAEQDFRHTLYSKSPQIRSRAWTALGDIQAARPNRNWEAIGNYRIAIMVNPGNLEAYLKASRAALALDTPNGYDTASEYLAELICIDPYYNNVFQVWSDTILVKNNELLRKVCLCLENHIKSRENEDSLWLDLAAFRYRYGDIEQSLEALRRLGKAAPEFRPVERHLLEARCQVELYDLERFEAAYDSALAAAGRTGEFNPLISQASAIFRPEEQAKADTLTTAEQWTDFFRIFWGRRDPNPLTPVNERMFEHYRRLREAESNYTIKNPYSRLWNSRDYYRHVSLQTIGAIYEKNATTYDYDPDLFYGRNRELMLGQRGLLYIRHGQPDEIIRPDSKESADPLTGIPSDEEIWRYRDMYFVFSPGKMGPTGGILKPVSIGEYFFVPFSLRGSADINKAMETESYADMLPELEQDFYTVNFMAPGGMSEFETYQSVSSVEVELSKPPLAVLAVYDHAWRETGRDSSAAFETIFNGRPYWVAVNSLVVEPGEKIFTAWLDIPGRRAVQRHSILLSPFKRIGLELSGVVLGVPVPASGGNHSRLGVKLMPRPSLAYTSGEIMTVYFEVYGLSKGGDGSGKYIESVTIERKAGDPGILVKAGRLFSSKGSKRASSLTLTFERQLEGTLSAVPENFTVDTSLLLPGSYRMLIEVHDANGGGGIGKTGCSFTLLEPE